VFLREVATAGGNVHTIFGEENHFRLKCALTEKRNLQNASMRWQREASMKGI